MLSNCYNPLKAFKLLFKMPWHGWFTSLDIPRLLKTFLLAINSMTTSLSSHYPTYVFVIMIHIISEFCICKLCY